MIELVIDGQAIRAEEGKTILDVARAIGIHIPTLCHHDAVSPSGACRLCIVEVYPRGSTMSYMTTACNFPVEEGMEVWSSSAKVLESRRMTVELLLAKEPESKIIQEIAADLGFLIKVNTVLIPNINMTHVRDIAYEIEKRGAYIMNIMPLIPLGEFKKLKAPTCDELIAAREACESIIPIFRACKQCRADACGIPGLEDKDNKSTIIPKPFKHS